MGDKKARPWLMAVGVALAGIGLALVGVLQSYWLVVAAAMISGIGNAMLHPEGARLANLTGGDDKAVSMSVFLRGRADRLLPGAGDQRGGHHGVRPYRTRWFTWSFASRTPWCCWR